MRSALYTLAGIAAVLGVAGFGVLLVEVMTWLFGPWGLFIKFLSLLALGGGYVGWSVYRMRLTTAARGLEPKP
ncbi:hypothetical protein IGS68_19140 [Skermanella sp. TT6]|uniref:Uncharacterized protein n=1 Tax=Skermanella cutis TaxID=2775420 RepID=A0ABX7B1G0_9PROT|nr:hypothetical protein [Skermanella sp. TT6]QQP88160.1 hypothetical protein IGS68_19140 [Skermanella sp. TT6]